MLVSRVFFEISRVRKIAAISMSEKTWPNWNTCLSDKLSNPFFISMSEKTWPNWNSIWMTLDQFFDTFLFPCLKRRGPIETQGFFSWHKFGQVYFHVWKDVAQLKPASGYVKFPARFEDFHVWKDVAQLKLDQLPAHVYSLILFPCLKRRGPIETSLPALQPDSQR